MQSIIQYKALNKTLSRLVFNPLTQFFHDKVWVIYFHALFIIVIMTITQFPFIFTIFYGPYYKLFMSNNMSCVGIYSVFATLTSANIFSFCSFIERSIATSICKIKKLISCELIFLSQTNYRVLYQLFQTIATMRHFQIQIYFHIWNKNLKPLLETLILVTWP